MDTKENFFLTEEAANWIGQKKSEYLSILINLSSRDDFGFEEYHLYDHLILQTIEHPDQTFDDNSDTYRIRLYLHTYQEKITFHQIVLGALIPDQNRVDVFIPVITFVTKNQGMVTHWVKDLKASTKILS